MREGDELWVRVGLIIRADIFYRVLARLKIEQLFVTVGLCILVQIYYRPQICVVPRFKFKFITSPRFVSIKINGFHFIIVVINNRQKLMLIFMLSVWLVFFFFGLGNFQGGGGDIVGFCYVIDVCLYIASHIVYLYSLLFVKIYSTIQSTSINY